MQKSEFTKYNYVLVQIVCAVENSNQYNDVLIILPVLFFVYLAPGVSDSLSEPATKLTPAGNSSVTVIGPTT